MTSFNRTTLLTTAILALAAPACTAQEDVDAKRHAKAKQVAAAWFDSLMRGDAAVTTSLSDVPFALDRKQIILSISELEKKLESFVDSKGKRNIQPTSIKVIEDKNEIQEDAFPASYILVQIMIEDEGVTLCVQPGDTYRVIGFSD